MGEMTSKRRHRGLEFRTIARACCRISLTLTKGLQFGTMNPHNGNCPWLPTNATPSPCGYQKRSCHVPRSPCAATTAATADAGAKSPTQPWQNGVCFMPERIPSAHHTNFAYLLHASLGFIKKMAISGKTHCLCRYM